MVCKGYCVDYKARKPITESRYANGQKRCSTCSEWIIWEGLYCPCCGYKLRVKPRVARLKRKLMELKA